MLVTCSVEELKRAFAIANKVSEASSVMRSGNETALISACQEGALVQKIDADETAPRAQLEISSEVVVRSAAFLRLFNGTAVVGTETDRLVIRVEEAPGSSCSFMSGFAPKQATEECAWNEGVRIEVPGTALRELLRRTVPRAVLPESAEEPSAFAILRCDREKVEVVGANSVVTAWGTFKTAQGDLAPVVLPRGLILRALEIDEVWENTVAIGIDTGGFLGNRDSHLLWPLVAPPFEPQWIFDAAKDLWRDEPRLSGWVKPRALSSIAEAFAHAGRPGAARVSWSEESVAVFPLYRHLTVMDAFGRRRVVPSEKPQQGPGAMFLRGIKPVVQRPGSLVLPTVALELVGELVDGRESQIVVTERHIVVGSPFGFVALHSGE